MHPIFTNTIPIMISSIWIGFVSAISFMEAWIKFRPKCVTLPIGLSIGQVVFSALNKTEWIFALSLVVLLSILKKNIFKKQFAYLAIAIFILCLQTFIFIPILDQRIEIILSENQPQPSFVHLFYVVSEVVKVLMLLLFGLTFPMQKNNGSA
jgi:hypothetical protein